MTWTLALVGYTRVERAVWRAPAGERIVEPLHFERGVRPPLIGQAKRLRQKTDVPRSRTNHRYRLALPFDDDLGAGAHMCQQS